MHIWSTTAPFHKPLLINQNDDNVPKLKNYGGWTNPDGKQCKLNILLIFFFLLL